MLNGIRHISYWSDSMSLAGYTWFPSHFGDHAKYMEASVRNFSLNQMVIGPVLLLVTAILAVAFTIARKGIGTLVCGLVGGAAGIWGRLTQASLQLGSFWVVFLILSIVILLASVAGIVMMILESRDKPLPVFVGNGSHTASYKTERCSR